MTHAGNLGAWVDLLDSQVPDILSLVIDAWEAMPTIARDAKEDPVSETLCRKLRQGRNRCDLPFRIDTQLVELDPAAGEDQGRMDIVFSPMVPRESIYFALECKRLNVLTSDGKIRPYFAEYVRFGLMRFVRGQYGSRVRFGGMLAFVLNGDLAAAITGIGENVHRLREELAMTEGDKFARSKSSIFPADDRLRETTHERSEAAEPICVQHLFMSANTAAAV